MSHRAEPADRPGPSWGIDLARRWRMHPVRIGWASIRRREGGPIGKGRNANRGLWATCPTTTTRAPTTAPAATRAPVTSPPGASPPATSPSGGGGVYFANCAAARAAGAAPLYRGDPGYRAALDRDNDGVACE